MFGLNKIAKAIENQGKIIELLGTLIVNMEAMRKNMDILAQSAYRQYEDIKNVSNAFPKLAELVC